MNSERFRLARQSLVWSCSWILCRDPDLQMRACSISQYLSPSLSYILYIIYIWYIYIYIIYDIYIWYIYICNCIYIYYIDIFKHTHRMNPRAGWKVTKKGCPYHGLWDCVQKHGWKTWAQKWMRTQHDSIWFLQNEFLGPNGPKRSCSTSIAGF